MVLWVERPPSQCMFLRCERRDAQPRRGNSSRRGVGVHGPGAFKIGRQISDEGHFVGRPGSNPDLAPWPLLLALPNRVIDPPTLVPDRASKVDFRLLDDQYVTIAVHLPRSENRVLASERCAQALASRRIVMLVLQRVSGDAEVCSARLVEVGVVDVVVRQPGAHHPPPLVDIAFLDAAEHSIDACGAELLCAFDERGTQIGRPFLAGDGIRSHHHFASPR